MRAEVEQRRLLDDVAGAYAFDQPVRVVRLTCLAAACIGPSDKHPTILQQSQAKIPRVTKYYGTTIHFFRQP